MLDTPIDLANRLFAQAVEALRVAAGPTASDADLLAVLTLGEGARRRLDQVTVTALAALERRGTFGERGYRSSAAALADRGPGSRLGRGGSAQSAAVGKCGGAARRVDSRMHTERVAGPR